MAMSEKPAPRPQGSKLELQKADPRARTLVAAIRGGDLDSLKRLVAEHPELASARLLDGKVARGHRWTLQPVGGASSLVDRQDTQAGALPGSARRHRRRWDITSERAWLHASQQMSLRLRGCQGLVACSSIPSTNAGYLA